MFLTLRAHMGHFHGKNHPICTMVKPPYVKQRSFVKLPDNSYILPRGSRYLIIEEVKLKDHDY